MATFFTNSVNADSSVDFKSMRAQGLKIFSDRTQILGIDSEHYLFCDGTGLNRFIRLPIATTLNIGHTYYAVNDTTGIIPVQTGDSSSFIRIYPNTRTHLICKDNTSVKGGWVYDQGAASISSNFSILGSYGANAAAGRYLEIFPSIASDSGPYLIPAKSAITAMSLNCVSASTGTMGVFLATNLVTPILTLSLSASTSGLITGQYIVVENNSIALKVTSGTIAKPYVAVYLATV